MHLKGISPFLTPDVLAGLAHLQVGQLVAVVGEGFPRLPRRLWGQSPWPMSAPREVVVDQGGVRTILEGLLEHVPVDAFYWSMDHDREVPGYLNQVRWQVRSWADRVDCVKDRGIPSDQLLEMARTSELVVRTSEARCNSPIVLRVGLSPGPEKRGNLKTGGLWAGGSSPVDAAVQTTPRLSRAPSTATSMPTPVAASTASIPTSTAYPTSSKPVPTFAHPPSSTRSTSTSTPTPLLLTSAPVPRPVDADAVSDVSSTASLRPPTTLLESMPVPVPRRALEGTTPPKKTREEATSDFSDSADSSAVSQVTQNSKRAVGEATPSAPAPASTEEVCQIVLGTAGVVARAEPVAVFARRSPRASGEPLATPFPRRNGRTPSPPNTPPNTPLEWQGVSVLAAVRRLERCDAIDIAEDDLPHLHTTPPVTPPPAQPQPPTLQPVSVLKNPESHPHRTLKKHVSFDENLVQEIEDFGGSALIPVINVEEAPCQEPESKPKPEPEPEPTLQSASGPTLKSELHTKVEHEKGEMKETPANESKSRVPRVPRVLFRIGSWTDSRPAASDLETRNKPETIGNGGTKIDQPEPDDNPLSPVGILSRGGVTNSPGKPKVDNSKPTVEHDERTRAVTRSNSDAVDQIAIRSPKPLRFRVLPDILPVNTMSLPSPHQRSRRLSESFKAPYRSVPLCLPSPACDLYD